MGILTVLLLTYNRLDYAKTTLESTLKQLTWQDTVKVHIASDGDTPEYIDTLVQIAENYYANEVSFSNSERRGYGANYNLALQTVHLTGPESYVLCLEDDWELVRRLDAVRMVQALEGMGAGCIRLGYIGFTQPLWAAFNQWDGNYWLWLDPDSPERHVFAGHPRIESVRWQRNLGPWPEGLAPGDTEFAVAGRPESRQGVLWPIDYVKPCGDLFAHIGTVRSW